ncbi:hypothetical protein IPM62_04095 [Candidatus Woesebacteria bacterium]|nr:MAG: hypothetical protein IPM62_04095 [Candidatus Woesebacteria bacterium]
MNHKEIEQARSDFKTHIEKTTSQEERKAVQEAIQQCEKDKKPNKYQKSAYVSEIPVSNNNLSSVQSKLPILIKNKFIKTLLILGFIVPLILLWVITNILKIDRTNNVFIYILVPIFFLSVTLIPFTGIIKYIAKILPSNFFSLLCRNQFNINKYRKDKINPTGKELKLEKHIYELYTFGFVTCLEWFMIIFGGICALISISVPFIIGHY